MAPFKGMRSISHSDRDGGNDARHETTPHHVALVAEREGIQFFKAKQDAAQWTAESDGYTRGGCGSKKFPLLSCA
ncbi:hypothetical protein PHLCEN_2v9931 [Hermanssonia centrifuga]|uniref:Uncharacterized protein n=1 Tax=Hermanssonia centrifuga TaxID=98765 RepID=A0A2R6NPE5_9APHY|nr:hypothetical protein PHLCEN_2v9931 [Hermanssonia centrifuga]